MSYCRFSSEDFSCDLYCYADASGGYTTHLAGNRVIDDIPKLIPLGKPGDDTAAWVEAYNRQSAFLHTAERAPIGLPHAGGTFNDPDLESFLQRLLDLRELGYKFPDYVLDSVREEIADEASQVDPGA